MTRGEPNPEQLQRYIEHGCFWQGELPAEARFYKHANRAYLEYAREITLDEFRRRPLREKALELGAHAVSRVL